MKCSFDRNIYSLLLLVMGLCSFTLEGKNDPRCDLCGHSYTSDQINPGGERSSYDQESRQEEVSVCPKCEEKFLAAYIKDCLKTLGVNKKVVNRLLHDLLRAKADYKTSKGIFDGMRKDVKKEGFSETSKLEKIVTRNRVVRRMLKGGIKSIDALLGRLSSQIKSLACRHVKVDKKFNGLVNSAEDGLAGLLKRFANLRILLQELLIEAQKFHSLLGSIAPKKLELEKKIGRLEVAARIEAMVPTSGC